MDVVVDWSEANGIHRISVCGDVVMVLMKNMEIGGHGVRASQNRTGWTTSLAKCRQAPLRFQLRTKEPPSIQI